MTHRKIRFGQLSADPVTTLAVNELCRYLKQMDPELVLETCRCTAADKGMDDTIWVGLDKGLCVHVPAVEEPELDDAIAVSVEQGSGYITGSNRRSVLLGAYRFLKALGCDWVHPGAEGERIPCRPVENIRVHIHEAASYRHRGVCIEGANSYENILEMIDFLPKIGMNAYFIQFFTPFNFFKRWYGHKSNPLLTPELVSRETVTEMVCDLETEIARRGMFYHKTGHGWTCEPFGVDGAGWSTYQEKEPPETVRRYLAQVDGRREFWGNIPLNTNLCYSNPDVRKRIAQAITDYCRENPHVNMLHFWLADGTNNHCECDICVQKLPSDWYVLMLNEIDEALTAAGLDTKVVFLIYVDLLWAPQELKLRNPERFVLMFAPITRNYGQNYTDHLTYDGQLPVYERNQLNFAASLELNLAQLRQWQGFFKGDSFDFDYHLMWAHLNDPGYEACARNLFEDMKGLSEIGLNGMISCQVQRCFFPTALPMQMMAAALWDKNCDYGDKARAYYLSAFGGDGLSVQQYLKEVSELFALYGGPSHGKNARIDGCLCRDYGALLRCVQAFRPVIDQHAGVDAPWSEAWKHLQVHSQYVLALAEAMYLTEQKDFEGTKAAVAGVVDIINRNELSIQKVMDGFNSKKHWNRRLDPEQCRAVVYV